MLIHCIFIICIWWRHIIPFRIIKQYNYIVCSKRSRLKDRRCINPSVKRYLQNKLFITNIVNTDKICNTCMHKYYNADTCHNKPANLTRHEQEDTDPDYILPRGSRPSKPLASPPSVSLNIPGASNSHARCVVLKKNQVQNYLSLHIMLGFKHLLMEIYYNTSRNKELSYSSNRKWPP